MATIIGTNGNNILSGTAAADTMIGRAGNDQLSGLGGNDRLNGGTQNDLLNGGTGIDTADYSNIIIGGTTYTGATAGVTVNLNLAGAQNTVGAGLDTLVSMENLIGTTFNDTLTGSAANNVLSGLGGNDVLSGLAGNDQLDGGLGNDRLNGGTGNDLLNGGTGTDTADYSTVAAGVTVDLTLVGAQNTGGAGLDTLVSMENLIGTTFNDTLYGNRTNNNVLSGLSGNDRLIGLNGNDTLIGGDGADLLGGGTGADIMYGGNGNDYYVVDNLLDGTTETVNTALGGVDTVESDVTYTLPFGLEDLNLVGAGAINGTGNGNNNYLDGNGANNVLSGLGGNDVLIGNAGNDTLNGGLGNDLLYGGAGSDTASYSTATSGVVVNLTLGVQNTGVAGIDDLFSIENLTGSNFNDRLTGSGANNVLDGGAGQDILTGSGGALSFDTFDYNAVFDSPTSGGRDVITDFNGQGLLAGDRIDLSTIDANTGVGGNQAFTWIGNNVPLAAGQLGYVGGVLLGNINGGLPDLYIGLVGAPALSVGGAGTDILL